MIRYFDHRPYDGTWYVIEEYVDGSDVEKLLNILEEKDIRKIFMGMLSGAAYLHDWGEVIRDIKLDNVLVSTDGHAVKITDLQFIGDLRRIIAIESPTWGSLRYAAPELVQNEGASASFQSDIYSSGVCLYYMLIKETNSVRNLNVLSGEAYDRKLGEMLNVIDPKYRGFLQQCLNQDPTKRFSSVQEMRYHFEKI